MSTAEAIEARQKRGYAISCVSQLTERQPNLWTVPSQSGQGNYWVRLDQPEPTCTCPDYEERGQPCKHVYAVQFFIERKKHGDGSETITQSVTLIHQTVAPRPTYRQDWPAYNMAQTNEKAKFQTLLFDLCQGVPDLPRKPGAGRKPMRTADMVFALAFKVYSVFSGRRFQTDLNEAFEKGYMSRLPRYNTLFDYFDNKALTPILHGLIVQSSLPLKSVEVDFAVDSSGFSTSRFVRWFDHKYGRPMQKYDWVKCHLMCGVKTNIVTAVEIGERYAGDCPQFAPMVRKTNENFAIKEVSADKAYASGDNMDLVVECGGTPYIAFKANATGARVRGSTTTYEKMLCYYKLRREDFLSHYHKRSNVESTFSMIKAKFDGHLRSKTDRAMINEALCKILDHNICCLIQSHYELGIAPTFWGREPLGSNVTVETEAEPIDSESNPFEMYDWL